MPRNFIESTSRPSEGIVILNTKPASGQRGPLSWTPQPRVNPPHSWTSTHGPTVYCTKYALPPFLERQGHHRGVSSDRTVPGSSGPGPPNAPQISPSRAGWESLRTETDDSGVNSQLVSPGWGTAPLFRQSPLDTKASHRGERPEKNKNLMSAKNAPTDPAAIEKSRSDPPRSIGPHPARSRSWSRLFPSLADRLTNRHYY